MRWKHLTIYHLNNLCLYLEDLVSDQDTSGSTSSTTRPETTDEDSHPGTIPVTSQGYSQASSGSSLETNGYDCVTQIRILLLYLICKLNKRTKISIKSLCNSVNEKMFVLSRLAVNFDAEARFHIREDSNQQTGEIQTCFWLYMEVNFLRRISCLNKSGAILQMVYFGELRMLNRWNIVIMRRKLKSIISYSRILVECEMKMILVIVNWIFCHFNLLNLRRRMNK